MKTKEAVTILMAYAACMLSENCEGCPYLDNCPGWTEAKVIEALKYLDDCTKYSDF